MADVILQTKGLTKYYGSTLAVDHFDLSVGAGCVCGFVGRNGAGKTTVIKMLMGLLKPTAGSAGIFGCDCQNLTPAIRERIGYVTEGHRLIKWMKIAEIEKFQGAFFPGRWDDKFFSEMIEYFDLSKKQKIKRLSNGQRAQVSLALTLASHPELLIMDDPTLGLDAAIRRQFLQGMIQLIMEQGRTVLFSSHILADVERVADRLIVIDKGVIRADCTTEQFRDLVRKVRFSFESTPPQQIDIEGFLNCRRSENELELTLVGTTEQVIAEWSRKAGARQFNIIQTGIEEQFIDYTAPHQQRRLFEWEIGK
ncbi:MAG: ABC transporter ATP-binding protein [Phycisphaerae bacterium]|jgi:ABC-2 type transport system ATP-binding protein